MFQLTSTNTHEMKSFSKDNESLGQVIEDMNRNQIEIQNI